MGSIAMNPTQFVHKIGPTTNAFPVIHEFSDITDALTGDQVLDFVKDRVAEQVAEELKKELDAATE